MFRGGDLEIEVPWCVGLLLVRFVCLSSSTSSIGGVSKGTRRMKRVHQHQLLLLVGGNKEKHGIAIFSYKISSVVFA